MFWIGPSKSKVAEKERTDLRTQVQDSTAGAQAGLNSGLTDYTQYAKSFLDPNAYQAFDASAANASNDIAGLRTQAQGMAANPGYTTGEKSAQRSATQGAYTSAMGGIGARAAMTNNPAAANAMMVELARERARASSQLEGGFGDARIAGQKTAFDAASGVAGMEQNQQTQQLNKQGQRQNALQLFQFPSSTNASMVQSGQALQGGLAQSAQQYGAQPGFFKQLALAAIPAIAGAATSKALTPTPAGP